MLFFAFQRFMPAPASGMIVKMEEKMKNERNTETGNDNIKSAGSSIAVQAGILAAATIIVRIIGLLYRAPLTAIKGHEGNGYYGAA